MSTANNFMKRISVFLRLDSKNNVYFTIVGSIVGIFLYLVMGFINFPEVTYMGLDLGLAVVPIKGGIDLPLVIIVVVAALCGPLAGFVVGFTGSLVSDIIFYQQIIALTIVNIAFGLLGLIIGIPKYKSGEGFSDGKTVGKLILFGFLGFLAMFVVYLIALIGVANQSFEGTLLFNVLPYFTIWLITLLLIGPVVVWIASYVLDFVFEYFSKA
ncbi:MAG: ECF transporter S component [Candidatus Hodarchaeales archaeon]